MDAKLKFLKTTFQLSIKLCWLRLTPLDSEIIEFKVWGQNLIKNYKLKGTKHLIMKTPN